MSDDLRLHNFTLDNLFVFKKILEKSIETPPQNMPRVEEYLDFVRERLLLVKEEILRRGEENNFAPSGMISSSKS
jgi:hypothetical protein